MKKILFLLCGVASIFLLACCGQSKTSPEGQSLFSFDLDAPTQVSFLDGDLDHEFPLTDAAEIQQLLELLNSYQYVSSDDDIGVGWDYGISVVQGDVTTFIMIKGSDEEEYIEYFTSPNLDGGESCRYFSEKTGTFSALKRQIDTLSDAISPES